MKSYKLNKEEFDKFLDKYSLKYKEEDNTIYGEVNEYDSRTVPLYSFIDDPFNKVNKLDIEEIKRLDIEDCYTATVKIIIQLLHDNFNALFDKIPFHYTEEEIEKILIKELNLKVENGKVMIENWRDDCGLYTAIYVDEIVKTLNTERISNKFQYSDLICTYITNREDDE